jgi:N-acetyl sugar amidotransferase
MKYCKRCLYPDTKPNLEFNDDGVCSACTAYDARRTIDWTERHEQFNAIVRTARSAGRDYDCIIPVSGGKDSTYQVVTALEHGLRPLAVTAMTDHLTDLGWQNLNNISKLGVDHIMVQPNQQLRRKLNKYCLETVGDISWPEHVLIFTTPIQVAVEKGIPLILYGECPENEYGGPGNAQTVSRMDRRWLEEFGGLNGLRVNDIVDSGLATEAQMAPYQYPNPARCEALGLDCLFLGQFFEWDGLHNAAISGQHGFQESAYRVEGGLLNTENLDNGQTGIHDYIKHTKFGFGRATDHACNAIRRGQMTREEGIELVTIYDGRVPWRYMDVPLQEVLESIGMTLLEFKDCVLKFTDKKLFNIGRDGWPAMKFKVGVDDT